MAKGTANASLIVGVSGLRGIVGESLTPEVAVRFAAAFGTWLTGRAPTSRRPLVVLGRDGRAGGEVFEAAAIAGLTGTGCRVLACGVASTPTIGVACDAASADAGVVVSASHNPQEWNGMKLLVREASLAGRQASDMRGGPRDATSDCAAPPATLAQELMQRFEAGAAVWTAGPASGDVTWDDDADEKHCLRVKSAVEALCGRGWHDLLEGGRVARVVTDSVNASSAHLDRRFFNRGRIACVQLGARSTGIFEHPPEPTRENLSGEGGLCDAVPGLRADIGFAQDPDADRLAIVDETGRYIGEEYTLVLCADALLSMQDGRPAKGKPAVVVNLSTSRMVEDVAAAHGAEVIRTPVGEANVVERMKALEAEGRNVVLGGEGNGGVIWPEVVYIRDSLSAIALVLSLMARRGKLAREMVAALDALALGGKGYAIVKRKAPILSKEAASPAVDAVAEHFGRDPANRIDRQDGARIEFPADGERAGAWVHVRASNTEPIMRLICEAPTEAIANAVLDEAAGVIERPE